MLSHETPCSKWNKHTNNKKQRQNSTWLNILHFNVTITTWQHSNSNKNSWIFFHDTIHNKLLNFFYLFSILIFLFPNNYSKPSSINKQLRSEIKIKLLLNLHPFSLRNCVPLWFWYLQCIARYLASSTCWQS